MFRIKDSLVDFSKIDFSKYPVLHGGEKNSYVKKMKSLVSIYTSMVNCFEDNDIKKAFQVICTNLVDMLEKKCLTVTVKIDKEDSAKQYNF